VLAQSEAKRANQKALEAKNEAFKADSAARVVIENEIVADSLRIVADQKRAEALALQLIAEQKARAANLLTAQSLANQSLKIRDPDAEGLPHSPNLPGGLLRTRMGQPLRSADLPCPVPCPGGRRPGAQSGQAAGAETATLSDSLAAVARR